MAKRKLTPEELMQKAKETTKEANKQKTPENEIHMSNNRVLTINPTKIKYFVNGDFNTYRIIDQIGIANLLEFSDGVDLLSLFLSAVFDKKYEVVQEKGEDENYIKTYVFDEWVTELLTDELTVGEMQQIIDAALKVNGVERNFHLPLTKVE